MGVLQCITVIENRNGRVLYVVIVCGVCIVPAQHLLNVENLTLLCNYY